MDTASTSDAEELSAQSDEAGQACLPASVARFPMGQLAKHRLARRFLELLIGRGDVLGAAALATPSYAACLLAEYSTRRANMDGGLEKAGRLDVLDVSSRDETVAVISRLADRQTSAGSDIRIDLIQIVEGKVAGASPAADAGFSRSRGTRPTGDDAWAEPLLETHDIQAHLLPGFPDAFVSLIFFRITELHGARGWIADVAQHLTTCEDLQSAADVRRPHVGIAFTFSGMAKLGGGSKQFRDVPFRQGMHRRSSLLGDPPDAKHIGHAANWVIGSAGRVPDGVLILGANAGDLLSAFERDLIGSAEGCLEILHRDSCKKKPPLGSDHEHFGFLDNISQPGIRGRVARAPDKYVTPRPAGSDRGFGGQNLVWPGEFVFGYPGQNATDVQTPGPVATGGPSWARNGSFLVYRRLRQDTALFRQSLEDIAQELRGRRPALRHLTAETLAAKLMGRWPNGTPVIWFPDEAGSGAAADPAALNAFRYLNATRSPGEPADSTDDRASSWRPGDPLGAVCPYAAHVRRAYPRDDTMFGISEASIEMHRILRRGIPFGSWEKDGSERGLAFLAYQTSIERQFEFITRAWLNNPNAHRTYDGHDPIVGQNADLGANRVRFFKLPYRDRCGNVETIKIDLQRDWVVPTGGGYFFAPSKTALHNIGEGSIDGISASASDRLHIS